MYYNDRTILYLNGKFIRAVDAGIDLYSQTLHYGYGAFEGIRSYQTANGTKIFRAREHYERLRHSCLSVGIPFRYETNELIQVTYRLLRENNLKDAYIRPLVYCSPNMSLTAPREVYIMIAVWEWGKYLGDNLLRLCISPYQRPNPQSVKVDAKITGHYVNSILATSDAKVRGFDEALMTDMNGNVAEAPGANFFFEKNGTLYTPPAGHILPGITRSTILSICRELDIPVQEKFFKPEEVFEADSAFLCGTAAEVVGVESVDAHTFRKDWKDSLGRVLQEAYKAQVLEKSFQHVII